MEAAYARKYMKILKSLIVVSVFFLANKVLAFENNKKEIGGYFSTKIYEERHPVDNSFFMSQDGFMLGLVLNADNYEDDTYFGYKIRLGAGSVDYTSAGTGTMENIPDYQLEGTIYGGLPIEAESYRLTPFTGFGYRYLLNASGSRLSSNGYSGYDRESRYFYMPFGLNLETKPGNSGSYWELRGEYLFFLFGQQKSYLSDVSPAYPDVTNDQEEGSGIKLSAKYYLDPAFAIEGYMDYWDIADSKLDISGNFMEPRNTTSETGVRLIWKY